MVTAMRRRSDGIDILRGLSILLVLTHHTSIRVPLRQTDVGAVLPRPLVELFSADGGDAVVMFFVISGFLITRRCAQLFGRLPAIRPLAFYRHRAARILPTLFLLLAVSVVLDLCRVEHFTFIDPNQSLGGAVISVLTCSFNWYEGRTNNWAPANWDVLWSLSIEEAFYIGFPLLCRIGTRPRIAVLVSLLVLGPIVHGAIPRSEEIWREKAYLPGFGAIATGMLAAMAARRLRLGAGVSCGLVALGAAACCVELVAGGIVWSVAGEWTILALTFGVAAMLLGFDALERHGRRTAPLSGLNWLRSLGPLTYEIYLSHMFVVLPLVWLFRRWRGQDVSSGWIVYLLVLPLCFVCGHGLARYWSRPAARWFGSADPRPLPG